MGNQPRIAWILLAASSALSASAISCSDYSAISGNLSNTSATLSEYMALGSNGCQIGDTIFYSFNYSFTPSPGSTDPNVSASAVQVTVGGPAQSPVFNFQADWIASGGHQTDVDIGFTAYALNAQGGTSAPPALALEGSTVVFSGTVEDHRSSPGELPSNIRASNLSFFPVGYSAIDLSPSLYPSPCATPNSGCPGNSTTGSAQGSVVLHDVQQLVMSDNLVVDSGGTGSGSSNVATLTDLQVSFTDAPEPSTLAPCALGLLVAGAIAFRRRL